MLLRWNGICWDALVCFVIAVFGANVVVRLRHALHTDLWNITYHRNALVLDTAILALQASSKLLFAHTF